MQRGVEVALWFVVLTGAYLVLIGPVSVLEVAVGAALAATSAVLAVSARSAERLRGRPAVRWLGWLPAVAAAVLADTLRLCAMLPGRLAGRTEPGRFAEIWLGRTEPQHRPVHRSVAMLAVSLAPGCYVVGVDRRRGVVRVHRIARPTTAALRLDRRISR